VIERLLLLTLRPQIERPERTCRSLVCEQERRRHRQGGEPPSHVFHVRLDAPGTRAVYVGL
jgi:hypothetical protein